MLAHEVYTSKDSKMQEKRIFSAVFDDMVLPGSVVGFMAVHDRNGADRFKPLQSRQRETDACPMKMPFAGMSVPLP